MRASVGGRGVAGLPRAAALLRVLRLGLTLLRERLAQQREEARGAQGALGLGERAAARRGPEVLGRQSGALQNAGNAVDAVFTVNTVNAENAVRLL